MHDPSKIYQELLEENSVLRQRIRELEISETEHKRAEEALRAYELRYQTIFETTGTTMLIVEEDMTISLANDGFESLTGYTREEVEGKRKWTEFVEKDDLEKMLIQHQLRRTGSGFAKRDYEFRLVNRVGHRRNVFLTVNLIPGTKRSIASLMDITEHKQIEEALRESEEKYRIIAENTVDLITIVDMNLRFTYVSPSVFRTRGFTVEEAIKHTLDQVLTPKSMQYAFAVFSEEMALETTGTANPARTRILELEEYKKDGSLVWLEVTMSYLRDKNGNPIGILQVSRDITERKKAEEALRESEERYRTILENIEDGYFEVDIAGNLTFFNDSLCRLNGYPHAEMMGVNYRQYTDKENSQILYQTFNKVFRTGEPSKGVEYEIIGKDGTKRNTEASASLIKNTSGQPIGFRGIMRNITERKRLERDRYQYEKLQGVLEMAGAICHELNQPMQIISGYSDLLLMNISENDPIHAKLDTISKQIHRMGTITKKLMTIKEYKTQDYAGFSRIIDINKSSAKYNE